MKQPKINCPYQDKDSNKKSVGFDGGKVAGELPVSSRESLQVQSSGNFDDSPMCEFASRVLLEALDGGSSLNLAQKARAELSQCAPCQDILNLQLKLRDTISLHLKRPAITPPQLRIEITKNLKRMKLGDLDITDFPPQNYK